MKFSIGVDNSECYSGSEALYSHNEKGREDVDTCLLSSILVGACICLVSFPSMWMIVMKRCEGLGGICLVCRVYAHSVLGCVFVFFWMCRVVVRLRVRFSVPCWSVLLHGMLGLLCVVLFVCSCSGIWWCYLRWVPDQLSWLDLYLVLSFQIRCRLRHSWSVCLVSAVFLVLLLLCG